MDRFAGLSLEHVPSGMCVPAWLRSELLSGKRLLIIHSSEHSRTNGIEEYPDPSLHLTFELLIEQLQLDLGLPKRLEVDGVISELLHRKVANLAKRLEFPLAHPDPTIRWNRRRTERFILLDKELSQLRKLPKWDEDPGLGTFRKARRELAEEFDSIHQFDIEHSIAERLSTREEPPFSLATIEGLVILDHPPAFSQVRISWLEQVLRFKPIHQLCSPGSHRLGEHGALIADIPVTGRPDWLAQGECKPPRIASTQRILLENRSDNLAAAHSLLCDYSREKSVLIIDASSERNHWKRIFENLGVEFPKPANSCLDSKVIQLISRLARLPLGEDSWSFESLILLGNLRSIPFAKSPLSDLMHPQNEDWQPRMHRHVLQRIARGFHLLGGRGSLRRWSNTLAVAKPTLGRDSAFERQALEETQWWLCCMSAWLHPFIPLEERLEQPMNEGCSSGAPLPINQSQNSPDEWLRSFFANIDWKSLITNDTQSLRAAQLLISAHNQLRISQVKTNLPQPETPRDWCDEFDELARQVKLPGKTKKSPWQVLSPEQAHGIRADLVILSDVTSQSWNLKPEEIPWIDNQTRIDLGLDPPEIEQMKARHQLHSWLNSADDLILLDPCLDEEGILASPIEQWLNKCKEDNSLREMCKPPEWISPEDWHPETRHRNWKMLSQDGLVWLCYHPTSMAILEGALIHNRAGGLPLDIRQRSGLNLLEGKPSESHSISTTNLLAALENPLSTDLKRRSPRPRDLLEGEVMDWNQRENLFNIEDLNLSPRSRAKNFLLREVEEWPILS